MGEAIKDAEDAAALALRLSHLTRVLRGIHGTITSELALDDLKGNDQARQSDSALFAFDQTDTTLGQIADRIYEGRRDRDRVFECHDLFHDPIWDILLHAFIAHSKKKSLALVDVALENGLSDGLALRYVLVLEQAGLIARRDNAIDETSRLVHFTDRGLALMRQAIAQIGHRMTAYRASYSYRLDV